MKENKPLTIGYLKERKDKKLFTLPIPEDLLLNLEEKRNILIIQTRSTKFLKFMVYPVDNDKIIKITIHGRNKPSKVISNLSDLLKSLNVVHTSGITLNESQFSQEIYLDQTEINDHLKKKLIKIEGIKVIIDELFIE